MKALINLIQKLKHKIFDGKYELTESGLRFHDYLEDILIHNEHEEVPEFAEFITKIAKETGISMDTAIIELYEFTESIKKGEI